MQICICMHRYSCIAYTSRGREYKENVETSYICIHKHKRTCTCEGGLSFSLRFCFSLSLSLAYTRTPALSLSHSLYDTP